MAGRGPPGITAGQGAIQLSATLWAFETISAEHEADANMITTFGKPPTSAFLRHACRGEIEAQFAHGAFNEADIIIVSTDTTGGLRGFCCVKKDYPKAGYLYVDLICSAAGPPRGGPAVGFQQRNPEERWQQLESGKTLLQALRGYCAAAGWRGIFLRAVSNVISYYYHLGWRFIKNCGAVEKEWIAGEVAVQGAFARANPEDSDTIDAMAKHYFAKFGDFSWYKGITRAELAEGKAEEQEGHDALGPSEYKGMTPFGEMLMKYDVPDQGYLMLWCPPGAGGGGGAGGGAIGGRRRSKRRKNTKKKRRKRNHHTLLFSRRRNRRGRRRTRRGGRRRTRRRRKTRRRRRRR